MDYYSMKRRELQALCKEHKIPANSANSVLADKLSQLLNEKQKPTSRQRPCIKSAVESTDESEPAVSRRQAKKVRFNPTNELVEYELRSGKKEKVVVTEMKSRRKSVAKKVAKPVVDNINTVELTDDDVQIPVRVTRSSVQGKADDAIPINEKKQSRRAVKDVRKETDTVKELESNLGKVTRSKAHTLAKDGGVQLDENRQNKRAVKNVEKSGDSVEGTTVGRVRVTRSKAQTLEEDVIGVNLNPQVQKKSGRKVVNDVENVEPSKEIMDIPVRVTRSRGQTLTDDVAKMVATTEAEKKITKRETKGSDINNNLSKVGSENNQELPRRISLRTRGVEIGSEDVIEKLGNGKRKKRSEESQHHADMESRQSRRNKAKVEDSTVLNPSVNKVEMVVEKKVTRSKAAALEMKSSEGNNKSQAKNEVEEPKKVNRRKSVMQKVKGKGTEKALVAKKEVVKENEMVEIESPNIGTRKTVKKRKSKEQSGNLSVVDEGSEDEDKVTGSVKNATENEIKSVASVTRSHKSKKQRGNPVNESPRRATRSASKSDGKAVPSIVSGAIIKDNSSKRKAKLTESKLNDSDELAEKTNTEGAPVSKPENLEPDESALRLDNQGIVESAILEGHQSASPAIISGEVTKGSSSKRKTKLSESKLNDSDKPAEKSNTERSPVSKSESLSKRKAKLTESKLNDSDELAEKTNTEGAPVSKPENLEPDESALRLDNQGIVESAILEGHQSASPAIISGEVTKGSSSKRKTKLSESKLNDSDKPAEKSNTERSPVSKSESLELKEKVTEIGLTPAIEESRRQLTRSAIRSERNAAINTTPGRVTRSGIKHKQNAGNKLFETVDKEKQQSHSAHKKPPLADAQIFSPEVIKNSNLKKKNSPLTVQKTEHADTIAVPSEISKEAEDQILEQSVDLSVSESVIEATIVMENASLVSAEEASGRTHGDDQILEQSVDLSVSESVREAAIVMENASLVSAEEASGRTSVEVKEVSGADIEKSPAQLTLSAAENETNATPHLTEMPNFEDETETNLSDIKKMLFSTAEVAQAMPDIQDQNREVNVKSATFSEAQVQIAVNLEKSVVKEMESTTKKLQTDLMVEEPVGSIPNVDISPGVITKGNNDDADDNCDSTGPSASLEQSYDKCKSKEMEASLEPSTIEDADQLIGDDESNDQIEKEFEQDVLTFIDPIQNPSAEKQEVADNDAHNDDDESVSKEEYDAEANGDDPLNQSAGEDVLQGIAMDENDIKDKMVVTQDTEQNELPIGKFTNFTDNEVDDIKELKSEEMPSTDNDLSSQIPILNKSDDEDGGMVNAIKEGETDLMPSTVGNVLQDTNVEGVNDNKEYESNSKLLNDDDDDFNLTVGVEPISEPSITSDDDAFKSHLNQSAGDDLVSKDDVEDDGINVLNEVELGSEPSNVKNSLEVSVSGNVVDSECVVDEKTDGLNGESEQEPLTSNDGVDVLKELERGSEPSNVKNSLEVSVSGNVVDSEFVVDLKIDGLNEEVEQEPLTSNDNPVMAEPVVVRNENMPMELEVLFGSSDKESEPVLNVDVSDSVGRSDSPKPASNENGIMGSILDANKYAVSKTLGDIDGVEDATGIIDTENDTSFCGSEQKSKESESVSPGISNERRTEEADNDHVFIEDCSTHGVDEENIGTPEKPTREVTSPIVNAQEKSTIDESNSDRFTEDTGVHGTLTEESLPITDKKEESPVDDTFSDPPTYFKDDDINKQEETQQETTSVDLGDHIFGIDEYREPDSANKCDDLPADIMKDDRVSEIEGSARASSSVEKGFSSAAELANPVTYLEKASTSLADGKLNQDVFIMKSNVNADVPEDYFNWPDTSLNNLFKTPTTNRSCNLKHNEEDAVGFTFPDDRSCDDMEMTGNRAHNFDHQWESEPFVDKTQDTATQGPENVINFAEFSHNYYCDGSNDNMSIEKEKEKKDKPN